MMEENKMNFFGFSKDQEQLPKFSEGGKKAWILYGDDNAYPDYLVQLMDKSSKHGAILKRKTDLTAAKGWIPTPNNEAFIKNENTNDDLNDIVYKSAYDLNLYGSYALLVTWSKDKKSIARIKYINTANVRVAKEIEEEPFATVQEAGVDYYYYSEDWSQTRKEKYKPVMYQGFSEKFNKETTQILYVKEYRPGTVFYTLPDYISSIDWIALDKEIANFHLSSIQQGFTPSMIISFNSGIPTEEEQQKIYKQVQKKYGGSDNGSKVFITYSDGADNAPTFTPISLNDSDDRFLMLEDHIIQNIVIAHRIPPVVAGIMIEGKLGGSDEVAEAEALFQVQVINGKQSLIERGFNKLFNVSNTGELKLFVNSSVETEEEEAEVVETEENKDK